MAGDNDDDPYRTPRSDLGSGRRPGRRGHPVVAIVTGASADLLGTVLMALLVTTLFATMLSVNGVPTDQIPDALLASKIYIGVMILLGLGLDVVGGYVAARIANHAEYKHALLTALLVVIAGAMLGGDSESTWAGWLEGLGIVLAFPCAMAGAHFYLLEKYRRSRPADDDTGPG